LGFGPAIDDGFYYDFVLSEPVTEADFPQLENYMKRIIKKKQRFTCEDLPFDAALKQLDQMGEEYKKEYALELMHKENLSELSFYSNGSFIDMCEGPHVGNSGEIPKDCFKLRSVAGAYWRGDASNVMMTRIYGWAFEDQEALEERIQAYQQAQERDHRKLGRELDIFVLDNEIGKGLPLWLPNGTAIRDELEKLMKELEFKAGFQRVVSPHLAKADLYYKTGHLPYYEEHMYPLMNFSEQRVDEAGRRQVVKETYALKPMNCPHHHRIFSSRPRSYRDLPLRLAEYGQVYRFEDSGAIGGLLRVRGMCMNDAHIYCTHEQIKGELKSVLRMYRQVYDLLGIDDFFLRLSRHDPQDPRRDEIYANDPEAWSFAESLLQEVLEEEGLDFVDGVGEAVFYGPKIDVQLPFVSGRSETASTVQLDFLSAQRLGLSYVDRDGEEKPPYVIHRAPLGTQERFVAFLLEQYGGAFPTWLAPVQVQIITVSDRFEDYATTLIDRLRGEFIRAEMGREGETVGKKIRSGITRKIPILLVVGAKEEKERSVSLRRYGDTDQVTMPFDDFLEEVRAEIQGRIR
jgi:threonyl-tRNA synthetase|tara:strand:- start:3120 stop:4838 length:1719 start_codon:yes stop_codon:yes gene_type:complete